MLPYANFELQSWNPEMTLKKKEIQCGNLSREVHRSLPYGNCCSISKRSRRYTKICLTRFRLMRFNSSNTLDSALCEFCSILKRSRRYTKICVIRCCIMRFNSSNTLDFALCEFCSILKRSRRYTKILLIVISVLILTPTVSELWTLYFGIPFLLFFPPIGFDSIWRHAS